MNRVDLFAAVALRALITKDTDNKDDVNPWIIDKAIEYAYNLEHGLNTCTADYGRTTETERSVDDAWEKMT